jgi:EAL domain-containing protein (putative c-di-GMP-specific phosphodiesterase class I)
LDIQITRAIGEIPAVSAVAPELALNLDAKLIGRGEVRALLSPLHEALRARHRQLAVELTEASFGEHPAKLQHFIHAVRDDGMRLAIDDFGGGRASLLRLREISFDILKVDRAFIRSIAISARDRTISGLAAQVAAELSGVSVAEGIETAAQAAWARPLGYCALQGFRIARPMPADELARWYEAWTGGERVRLLTEMDAHDTDRLGPSCPPGLSHN